MKRILAFGASSSIHSINKQLAYYAVNQLENIEIDFIDLNDFEMPIFSIDKENDLGIPEAALRFKAHIRHCDGILISFAEHNGSYSSAFKNILDWASRVKEIMWHDKPMYLMATSPGARGGKSVLESAINRFGFMNGIVVADFSLPGFNSNFESNKGILDEELRNKFDEGLDIFKSSLEKNNLKNEA